MLLIGRCVLGTSLLGTVSLASDYQRLSTYSGATQEPWIRGILAGHVGVFLLVLLCRRNVSVLTGVFAVLGVLLGMTPTQHA